MYHRKKNHHKIDDIKTPQQRAATHHKRCITNSLQNDVIQTHHSDVTQCDAIQTHHKGT